MKVDIIRKFKWYVVGFILVVIMLSVGLSFCTWDDYSLKAVSANGKTGSYGWSTIIKKEDGTPLTTPPTLGQVVQYGRFWQDKDAEGEAGLKPQRWIVVDIDAHNNVATLLAEKVVVFGNFWGNGTYYQNYYQSTVRSWLNSGKGSLKGSGTSWKDSERYSDNTRNDGVGSAFGISQSSQANKGFLDVAFNDSEKSILVPKRMAGMQGFGKNDTPIHDYTTTDGRSYINDLVWLPSWQEIYGTKENEWSGLTLRDGTPNTKLSYFDDVKVYSGNSPNQNWVSAKAKAGVTAYAMNAGTTSYFNNGNGGNGGATPWWWLRSPLPSFSFGSLMVHTGGSGVTAHTNDSSGGVRPAVCVQL